MKISKSLLQAIAVAVTVGTTAACTSTKEKEPVNHGNKELKKKKIEVPYDCPGCGLG